MTNTPTPLDPIAQIVAKYQSNGQQPTQTTPQPKQKKDRIGFRGKTLWDWLNLLGVFLVPIIIPVALFGFSIQQNTTSQAIALDQQRATTIKTYMDDMTGLLLQGTLRESQQNASVRVVARAKTLVALSQLDGDRKGTLIRFLYEAQLIGYISYTGNTLTRIDAIIDLRSADLSEVNLREAYLFGIDLSRANLDKANLSKAHLNGANLSETHLNGANLSEAYLSQAYLSAYSATWANLKLPYPDIDLREANLSEADLSNAYLSEARLDRARVEPGQLAKAKYLKDAILPDGSRYPSSSYRIPNHREPTN